MICNAMDLVTCKKENGGRIPNFNDLPYEIVEMTLSYKGISHVDLYNVAQVCRKLRHVVNSCSLWRLKFYQEWGALSQLYDNNQNVDWKKDYLERLKYGYQVHKLIANVCDQAGCSIAFNRSLLEFQKLSEGHRFAAHFMLDEMQRILFDGDRYSKLTTKYYCKKLLHFAHQHHLKAVFREFLEQCENQYPPLETGAAIISQFFQADQRIVYKDISDRLDNIAVRVKRNLKEHSPNHPVLLKNIIPPSSVLSESLWSPADCRVILECLNFTMFKDLKFEYVNEDLAYSTSQILIDKVLAFKEGVPNTMSLIYAALAHRLGVLCELCEFGVSLLGWVEHPELDDATKYTLIDTMRNGKFVSPSDFYVCKDTKRLRTKLPKQVFKDMVRNLSFIGGRDLHHLEERLLCESSSIELDLLLSTGNPQKVIMLIQLYLQMDAQLFEVKRLLTQVNVQDSTYGYRAARLSLELESRLKLCTEENNENSGVKLRDSSIKTPHVLFTVGMIMKHKKYEYICVIYGWDTVCNASEHWIQQMRVFELQNKNIQPFYNVLVEDGTQRYAAQENLEVCLSPRFIKHPDVGKYFDAFKQIYFVPNKITSAEYPEDAVAREAMLKVFFNSPPNFNS